jgi:hypothetical protein
MHEVQLQLTDQIYDRTKRRALEAGFNSVSEFIADVISDEVSQEVEDFDHLFTPERLAHIDQVIASLKAGGQTFSVEEVSAQLKEHRAEWIRKNSQ